MTDKKIRILTMHQHETPFIRFVTANFLLLLYVY